MTAAGSRGGPVAGHADAGLDRLPSSSLGSFRRTGSSPVSSILTAAGSAGELRDVPERDDLQAPAADQADQGCRGPRDERGPRATGWWRTHGLPPQSGTETTDTARRRLPIDTQARRATPRRRRPASPGCGVAARLWTESDTAPAVRNGNKPD